MCICASLCVCILELFRNEDYLCNLFFLAEFFLHFISSFYILCLSTSFETQLPGLLPIQFENLVNFKIRDARMEAKQYNLKIAKLIQKVK